MKIVYVFLFGKSAIISKCLHKVLLLWFFFLFFTVTAQDPHPAFKSYDVEDGLPSSKIYQVKQDSKGYMWFATDNGVSRFNGYEFEHFSVSDGLPDNTVFEIFEDKKGRVWFVSLTNRLFYYEQNKMHLYKYNNVIDQIEGDHLKTSFCVAENGSVFLGLFGYGIIEITEQGILKRHTLNKPSNPNITVIEPVFGSLIYVCNNLCSEKSSIRFDTRFLKGMHRSSVKNFKMHPTTRFIWLRNNKIIFSYDNTLHIIDNLKTNEVKHFNERINWIYEDRDTDLWIGTYMGGVYHIENGDFEHKKNYLKDLFVTGVMQDNQGGFWFTTEGNSVYYTPSKKIMSYDQISGLKDARIMCLASDTEGIYLGLQRSLIHKITLSGNIKSYVCPAENKTIMSLYYDRDKRGLWFSGSKMSGFIGSNKKIRQYNFTFAEMLRGQANLYWQVNSDGLSQLLNGKRIPYYIPKIKRTSGIFKKDNETLLLGTIDGLWEYNITSGVYKHLYQDNPLLCNRVLDIAYANDGTLLLATKGAGLLLLDKNDSVQQINYVNGLSSDNIRKILVDGPIIWLATDKGLNKLVKDSKNSWEVKAYTINDGLISNEIYDVHKFNHKIWVATDKGLSFFNPDALTYNSEELPLYIKQIVVNDSNKTISDHYNLDYFENNIKIKFISLSYKNSEKLQYRYKMTGLNAEWNYTEEREIQYTTLPPGNYTFVVSVLNDNGIWSRDVCIKFAIATPFWKAWWFIIISVILVTVVLFFVINYWIARQHREKNKEEEINQVLLQLKLKALRAQMNPHFIFNVMNSIQHFIIFNNNQAAHRYLSKFSKLIRAILNNSEENTVPLAEEVKALTLYLELEDMRFENHFQYTIDIDETIDINTTEIPSMLIQPYVENAVKHGMLHSVNAGKIKIKIEKQVNFLKCSIEDNGVGMEASQENKNSQHRSFGTFITKERLQIINELYNTKLTENVINLYDEKGNAAGTKIELFIPYTVKKRRSMT